LVDFCEFDKEACSENECEAESEKETAAYLFRTFLIEIPSNEEEDEIGDSLI
jgi:hypothetical protein